MKLEAPSGDWSRTLPPHFVGSESCYYLSINRNKKGIVIDMKTPEGLDLVKRLADKCDILMENFRPGVLDRLGLTFDDLCQRNPGLIWASISGFGQDGPYRDRPAYDMIVQAMSGGMSLTGEPGRAAVRARHTARRSVGRHVCGDRLAGGARGTQAYRQGKIHRYIDARLPGRHADLPGGLSSPFRRGAGPSGERP